MYTSCIRVTSWTVSINIITLATSQVPFLLSCNKYSLDEHSLRTPFFFVLGELPATDFDSCELQTRVLSIHVPRSKTYKHAFSDYLAPPTF